MATPGERGPVARRAVISRTGVGSPAAPLIAGRAVDRLPSGKLLVRGGLPINPISSWKYR